MSSLKNHKGIIIIAVMCAALLMLAYFSGGEPTEKATETTPLPQNTTTAEAEETAVQNPVPTTPAPLPTAETEEQKAYCTLSVRCDTILLNFDRLDPTKAGIIPAEGVIFAEQRVEINSGDSVFSVLEREMRKNNIHLEFVNTPAYGNSYIEGIANIYEFDCGELSGWMYRVNGAYPGYGCSQYMLNHGDKIEWIYSCDLGRDVGGEYSARNGKTNEEQ